MIASYSDSSHTACEVGEETKYVDWMLESFHFPRGPSMFGIRYQKSVYMLVVLICSRI